MARRWGCFAAVGVLVASCGAKTGLEIPLPPLCDAPPPVRADTCTAVALGAALPLGPDIGARGARTFSLQRGVWVEIAGADRDYFVVVGEDARPMGDGLEVARPFPDGASVVRSIADGCVPVTGWSRFQSTAPALEPGRCAILPLGAERWVVLPGSTIVASSRPRGRTASSSC